ncbi:LacI family DNA-binding transcriptional regulator [Curtobacterium sp. MCPF17_052]|uniref:LacI family DNA-binding transcriptional regulator n=1 Tax=Curtobacterium sp. MCPF17_052 TaxID=2175655 RepID=UPI0024DFF5EE|nr:LacI family DNA-binding transcriptional regulator [Curtobacterium sp. MCPF17_052]WIB11780.1 LacI family DNA-binding transcriptional regulator [Curtobacterium sp. MCPF17_052]
MSKSLVSLVLQRSPRVSEQRRAAVLAAIQELDYRPSTAAVSLAGTRSRTIGVVLDDFRNQWFVDLLTGLRESLQDQGHRLVVADRFLNTGLDVSPVEGFLSMRVEGLVIAGEPDPDLVVPAGTPVVVAGGRAALPRADTVANDDLAGGRMAAGHLVELGHVRLGFVGGRSAASDARLEGWRAGIDVAAGVGDDVTGVAVVLAADVTEETGVSGTHRLLDEHPDVTAVFAANDVTALGAMSAIADRGLRVPEDVSVIGYDDTPIAASRYVGLTSIDDRSIDIGRGAGARLLERIADPTLPTTEVLVEPRLVARRTTARR